MGLIRRRNGLRADTRTFALGGVATALAAAVIGGELARVWHRGSAPLPAETEEPLLAAAEAVAETASVARAGYENVSVTENALFNLFTSFVVSFISVRAITTLLRDRRRVGPFRNLMVGRRHIHHFVPGIALTFVTGTVAIATRREGLERWLAVPFGAGMGLTLDESALLLELDDVYWSEEGIVSVQIALAAIAMLSAVALAARFLRRGEELVLDEAELA
ncbi:MAG TPA: hypothetical protein VEX36_01415 [Thermoleophilaceae bacterium]|nr:hypothetical protein [Thermoleophilaceae bacterium]